MKFPENNPPMGELLFVIVQEWGQPFSIALVSAFQSSLPNQIVQWALDRTVYNLDCPHYLAEQVRYWAQVEIPGDVRLREAGLIGCME
jgi:hypothetical protein